MEKKFSECNLRQFDHVIIKHYLYDCHVICFDWPEETSCEFGSNKYYALCGFGGILSCGITHTAVVPLDLVKCRIQVNPQKYGGIVNGFRLTVQEGGMKELSKGWAPTAIGYSAQGLCKFGFYEVFKIVYGNFLGEVNNWMKLNLLYCFGDEKYFHETMYMSVYIFLHLMKFLWTWFWKKTLIFWLIWENIIAMIYIHKIKRSETAYLNLRFLY